ncbi:MAG: trigger factor [Hyphomicrobiaceae bacterium]
MQVTETSSEGLKRQVRVVVGATELAAKRDERIDEIKDRVQIKGFRKGKVPVAHLRKVYGRSMMAEVLQQTVEESSRKVLTDRNERAAVQPKIELPEDQAEIEKVIDGRSDLAYSMSYEVLPPIAVVDFSTLKLERLVADVDDAAVEDALKQIAERNTSFSAEDGRAAQTGDKVKIDFAGKIDGEPFDGGTAEGVDLVLGQASFIPGFEDALVGVKAGEEKTIAVTFPADYQAEHLKGKPATFDVKVHEVAKSSVPAIDDELAKSLGVEDLAKLKDLVKGQIAGEYAQISRAKLKRALLDQLDKAHTFELPPTLVEAEFDGIWKQVTQSLEQAGKTFADEGKTEEGARAEYREIASRRVRLGLIIGEVGEKNEVSVGQEELRRALVEQARRFPGQERFVYEYYEKTPGALGELRAPIFEDKVVDIIIDQAKPAERKVSREELVKPLDGDEAPAA